VIGTLKGTGGGATLMFMRIWIILQSQETVSRTSAFTGAGLVNYESAFLCYIEAVAAIQRGRGKLKGRHHIAGVVGEIEKGARSAVPRKSYRGAGRRRALLMDPRRNGRHCIIRRATGLSTADRQRRACCGRE